MPDVWALALLATALVASVATVVMQARRCYAVRRAAQGTVCAEDGHQPTLKATIVVYAHNDATNLERFLPYLLNQDYPDFEVIVVNGCSTDNTPEIMARFQAQYGAIRLRQTFVPESSRNVSQRKLAIMLGVKAALGDIIVVTNANCRPDGPQWLGMMCSKMVPGTDVVIGYAHPNYKKDRSAGRGYRVYDIVSESVQYLSCAMRGHAMRGTNSNLAYRRSAFFANNGFSKTMSLHYGDDDLFVSELAAAGGVRVQLEPEAVMTVYHKHPKRSHHELKLRHGFTSRGLRRWPFIASSLASAGYCLAHLALIGAVVRDCANGLTLTAAATILILLWAAQMVMFHINCHSLSAAPCRWPLAPLYALWRPWVNALFALRGHAQRESNYTWHRLK